MIMFKNRFTELCIILFVFAAPLLHSGERENLDRVLNALEKTPYERRYLLADNGGFGSSILVKNIADTSEAPITFVAAVPLYADFAVSSALDLIKKIRANDTNANILVAFLGDERNSVGADLGGISHKGLRDLLTLAGMPENWVLCYVDIDEKPEKIIIRHGISRYVTPLDIVKPLPELFKSHDIPWYFRIRHNGIYKLGLVEGSRALSIAWNDEINGVVLSGHVKQQSLTDDLHIGKFTVSDYAVSEEKFADCLFEYAGLLTNSPIKGGRYYSHFRLPGGKALFINEGLTAGFLIIIIGFLLVFYLFRSAPFNAILVFNLKLFRRFIWFFIILLPLLVFSVRISGLFYSVLLRILNPAGNVLNNAGAFFTVLLGALIFLLPSPALDFIRIPRQAMFFSVSAVIFSIMGFFFAAFLDFSYVPAFLWAFLFVFIGSLNKNHIVVFLCVLMIPVFAFDTVFNIIEAGSTKLAELLITSDWKHFDTWIASVITALFLLPFFLLLRRALLLRSSSGRLEPKQKRKIGMLIIPGLITLVLIAMVLQILFLPAKILPERRFYKAADDGDLSLTIDSTMFQDSRIITLRITAKETPVRFDVIIESEYNNSLPPVYSAPVPFFRENGGRRIRFSLGENPPNPLVMEIVVSEVFMGRLSAAALYNTWIPSLDPGGEPKTDDYILGISGSIGL